MCRDYRNDRRRVGSVGMVRRVEILVVMLVGIVRMVGDI
jgi:hypothetical protein